MNATAITRSAGPPAADTVEVSRHSIRTYRLPAKIFHWVTVALIVFMVTSAVIAKQLNDGPVSDLLFTLHKLTGLLTLAVVLLRLCYRVVQWMWEPQRQPQGGRRPVLHWIMYCTVILVPLLGWSGVSAFGSREILPGFVIPEIWPKGVGADMLLLLHAYAAFCLLALVVLHIGIAMQDYMMRADEPGSTGGSNP